MKMERKKQSAIKSIDDDSVNSKTKKKNGRQSMAKKVKNELEVDRTFEESGTETKRGSLSSKQIKRKRSICGQKITPSAQVAMSTFLTSTTTTGVDCLRKDFAELKTYVPPNYDHSVYKEHAARNRYKDVVCLDATRVVLTQNVPPEHDYIHANWIKMEHVDKKFIAAQGPLENTISDFWRMIHQENAVTILMLCKIEECGKVKCAQYWPTEQGSYKTYGSMFVNNKKLRFRSSLVENDDKTIIYTLEVLPEGCSNSVITKLYYYQEWPDRGVPGSCLSVLRLIKYIDTAGPCVVHCSAGIGRTGTIIAIETGVQRLLKGNQVNIKDIVIQLRNQRASSVQTEAQYIFVHVCLLNYIMLKMPNMKNREAVVRFQDKVDTANMA
ncbi:hypothetical protein L596_030471 [Steinernema carpocapsae]|uniref:Tyrosine-protein phosphatase domain-containing protein n=1 Tax=Steinernema carpocapsae TaxID=34508 RepID=A0A4U5LPI2_STECR|nr:hypothetical protein L596_030471 [Steinernema carpocapsae]